LCPQTASQAFILMLSSHLFLNPPNDRFSKRFKYQMCLLQLSVCLFEDILT
jgi:hypothetical protein